MSSSGVERTEGLISCGSDKLVAGDLVLLKSDPSKNGLVLPLWRHTEIAPVHPEVDVVTLIAKPSERVL